MNTIIAWVGWGWILRRLQEWGSLGAVLVSLWMGLPPGTQQVLENLVMSGRWETITLGTIVGTAWYLFSQWQSWRATTKPQVVTVEGVKVDTKKELEPSERIAVEREVKPAAEQKKRRPLESLLNGIFGR